MIFSDSTQRWAENLLSERESVVVAAAAAHFRSRRSSKLRAKMDPPYIQALKGEWGYMKMGFFRDYHAKYMAPGKYRPVVHVIMFVMGLGYLMEYPHLKRARRRSPPTGGTRRTPLRGRHAPRGRASLFFGAIPATYLGVLFPPRPLAPSRSPAPRRRHSRRPPRRPCLCPAPRAHSPETCASLFRTQTLTYVLSPRSLFSPQTRNTRPKRRRRSRRSTATATTKWDGRC